MSFVIKSRLRYTDDVMATPGVKINVLLISLWIVLFATAATHLNIKGTTMREATFFTSKDGYNFEYKYGYPTPWYSRYYAIPNSQIARYGAKDQLIGNCALIDTTCKNTPTPPHNFLVYTDVSGSVLAGQALLALVPSTLILAIYRINLRVKKRRK
jgi:hypothetical protein